MLGPRARRDVSVVDTGKPVAGSPMPPTAFSGAVAAIRAMSWVKESASGSRERIVVERFRATTGRRPQRHRDRSTSGSADPPR